MSGFASMVSVRSRAGPLRRLQRAFALVVTLAGALPAWAGQVSLSWDASTDTAVVGYYMYYGQASRTYPFRVDVGNQTSYAVPNLTEGQTYYFAVTAYNAARVESVYSNEVYATIPSPPAQTPPPSSQPTAPAPAGPPAAPQPTPPAISPAIPVVPSVKVVEFYNASLDHYFISISAQEISDLDRGVHTGWVRTGLSFKAFDSASPGTNPVCRFYIPPEHGDSHFFSASIDECDQVLRSMQSDPNYSGFVYESPDAFYIGLPDANTGSCPAGTVKVYRLWNNRADSDHRFTAVAAIKAAMVAEGSVAEGYGPDAVAMCAPQ